jgi:hypothetical protein
LSGARDKSVTASCERIHTQQYFDIDRDCGNRERRPTVLVAEPHILREATPMLFKLRCPHTGVINFFSDTDPAMAVGSITEIAPFQFVWRSYLERVDGSASRLALAEAHLTRALSTKV